MALNMLVTFNPEGGGGGETKGEARVLKSFFKELFTKKFRIFLPKNGWISIFKKSLTLQFL